MSNAIKHQYRGFHSSPLGAVWAKKANNPPKGPTCASRFSKCPSRMDPIPFALAVAPPRVHIMH